MMQLKVYVYDVMVQCVKKVLSNASIGTKVIRVREHFRVIG